jgi:putative flippase GtrA
MSRGHGFRRDVPLFLLVGGCVGIVGHRLLLALLALGVAPVVANTVQAVLTLQVNFVANSLITWRRRMSGSVTPVRVRWLRFQVARLASLLLSVAMFPVSAPVVGTSVAYWSLLAAGAAANFCLDRYWSFRPEPRHRASRSSGLPPRPIEPRRLVLGILGVMAATIVL